MFEGFTKHKAWEGLRTAPLNWRVNGSPRERPGALQRALQLHVLLCQGDDTSDSMQARAHCETHTYTCTRHTH